MYWCEDHQNKCSALVEEYKGRRACGTRETNPDFRETRCSTLNYNIDSMTLDELQKVKPDLEERKKRVSRCVERRNKFQRQCIHPSRHDQRHAKVLVDLLDEGLLCQDMLVRLLARLDYLEEQVFVQAEQASISHESAKAGHIAAKRRLRSMELEVKELARTVDKLESQKRQVRDLASTFTEPGTLGINPLSKIAAIRKQGTSKRNTKGEERITLSQEEPANDARGKAQREDIRRANLVQKLRDLARTFQRGQDAFECLLLAALLQFSSEQGIAVVFGGDIFMALESAPEMNSDRLQEILALVTNPSAALEQEGLHYQQRYVK